MKKILITILISSLFLFTACALEPEEAPKDILKAAQERGKFIVGVSYKSKPLGFLNSKNEPDGFEIDIAKNIAKNILGSENAIEFKQSNGYNSIMMVASGDVDFLIAATTITPQRQITTAFSEPYYQTGQAIIVRQDSKIKNVRDLNKKKVIVRLNSTAEHTPQKFAPAAILLGFKTRTECFNALKNNQADAMISDEAILKGFVADNPNFKILPQKLSLEQYGIVFKNTEEAKMLKDEVNKVLQIMKANGTLDELKTKWNL